MSYLGLTPGENSSASRIGIEPWAYLRDVMMLLPSWPRNAALELAPKSWHETRPQPQAQRRLAACTAARKSTNQKGLSARYAPNVALAIVGIESPPAPQFGSSFLESTWWPKLGKR